jgi:hypothetical protein
MALEPEAIVALRALSRKRKPIEIEGLGRFIAKGGHWAFEERGATLGELARAIGAELRRDGRCELPMGVFTMHEVKALGGGKGKMVRRYKAYRSGAIPERERVYPGEGFEGDLGLVFKLDWTVLDPLFVRWVDRLAIACAFPTGIEPSVVLDVGVSKLGLAITDCLQTFTGGFVGATKGVDWIDGLITAVALAEADGRTRTMLRNARPVPQRASVAEDRALVDWIAWMSHMVVSVSGMLTYFLAPGVQRSTRMGAGKT